MRVPKFDMRCTQRQDVHGPNEMTAMCGMPLRIPSIESLGAVLRCPLVDEPKIVDVLCNRYTIKCELLPFKPYSIDSELHAGESCPAKRVELRLIKVLGYQRTDIPIQKIVQEMNIVQRVLRQYVEPFNFQNSVWRSK